MELMKYSKVFAVATAFALLAACGGDAKTQEGVIDEVVAQEMHTDDGAMAGADGATASGLGSDADASASTLSDNDLAIPAISTIYFDFDKSNIRSEFYDVLNGHAAYLMANPSVKVKLHGHTDARGSAEYNMALGERRGNSVQRYLSLQGVSLKQLEVVSYGKMQLADKGNSNEAHSKNRRVVFSY